MKFDAFLEFDASLDTDFARYAVKELKKHLKRRSATISSRIEEPLQELVRHSLISTPEYRSLQGGKLQGELGVTSPSQRIQAIIETWVSHISVTSKVATDPLLSISIGFIEEGYADVLSLAESAYDYEGGTIPWLRWLLLEGDTRIVRNFEFSPVKRGSRTGLGIMTPSVRRGWQVPSEFSGTETNNFATRAFDGVDIKIEKIVKSVIKSSI